MTKFSITQLSTTSLSSKWAAIFLFTTSVFVATGFSFFKPWWQARPRLITPSAEVTIPPAPEDPVIAPPPAANIEEVVEEVIAEEIIHNEVEAELADNQAPIIEQAPAAPEVFFLVAVQGEEEERFDTWEAAREKIEKLSEGKISLSIEFSPNLITDHHDEEHFRAWLARVGDYIFARRILLIGSLKQVLQNRDFGRVLPHEVEERGCALLEKGEKWRVTIRGLEQPIELIKVGEEILLRAVEAPSSLAKCETLKEKAISEILSQMRYELTDDQARMSDLFLKACTQNTAMRENNIHNLGAFLALVPFDEMESIDEKEQGYIAGQRDAFFNDFHQEIVKKTIKDSKITREMVNINLIQNKYPWLSKRLRRWTEESNISSSLIRSLFNDAEAK